jgi:hypothetical protein
VAHDQDWALKTVVHTDADDAFRVQETVLHTDMPAFGEVVHAPPTVQLKRKHWDPAAGAAQEQEQHQQQQQTRQKQKQQQQRMHAKKPHHGQQSPDEELVQMREALIEGYRAGRAPRGVESDACVLDHQLELQCFFACWSPHSLT